MIDDTVRQDNCGEPASPTTQRRRAPVQERAKQQVTRILDAAAELIAEVGVDNTTTNAIAARVRISVGTLYQYFPNKEALVRALAVRYLEVLDAVLPVPADEDPAQWSLPQEVERAVQVLERFIKEHPGFPHVYRAARGASDPENTRLLDHGKAHFEGVFARRAPWVAPEERRTHATVVVEAAHSLLRDGDDASRTSAARARADNHACSIP